MPLDGITFHSVQAKGKAFNVVLFHKAARVEKLDIPAGTEISAQLGQMTEDGWEDDYTVYEEVPPKAEATPADESKKGWPNFEAIARIPWEPGPGLAACSPEDRYQLCEGSHHQRGKVQYG
jgi:hypothetical protein